MLCRRGRATRACAGPRAFPKGTLHLNGEPIAPHLLRDLNANSAISLQNDFAFNSEARGESVQTAPRFNCKLHSDRIVPFAATVKNRGRGRLARGVETPSAGCAGAHLLAPPAERH